MKVTITATVLTVVPKSSRKEEGSLFGSIATEIQHFLQRASDPAEWHLTAQAMLIAILMC